MRFSNVWGVHIFNTAKSRRGRSYDEEPPFQNSNFHGRRGFQGFVAISALGFEVPKNWN